MCIVHAESPKVLSILYDKYTMEIGLDFFDLQNIIYDNNPQDPMTTSDTMVKA